MSVLAPASPFALDRPARLAPGKFVDPAVTLKGEARASVALDRLETLWINTGTLCNLACPSCYILSSPRNDALVYPSVEEIEPFLVEAKALGASTIGFTGGEPFMNPDMIAMMRRSIALGFELLVLTNAMRPMRRFETDLAEIGARAGRRVTMRVSLDHPDPALHEAERGAGSFAKAMDGLGWLADAGFRVAVAGRRLADEKLEQAAFETLMADRGIVLDHLILFPSMDAEADVPEISVGCWRILGVSPSSLMCASSRMLVKAKGADRPHLVACTLLPYDPRFAFGGSLAQASGPVPLNHPHCARFCVLGGASCTG